jgi:hypothetical protein
LKKGFEPDRQHSATTWWCTSAHTLANFIPFQQFLITACNLQLDRVPPQTAETDLVMMRKFLTATPQLIMHSPGKTERNNKTKFNYAKRAFLLHWKAKGSGKNSAAYSQMPSFLQFVGEKNPGCSVALQEDHKGRFYRAFVATPIASPTHFGELTLPLFVADCTHYKELTYDGVIFNLCTHTPYGRIVYLAFAIIPSESVLHLSWVLQMCWNHGIPLERHALFSDEGPLMNTLSSIRERWGILFKVQICREHFYRNILHRFPLLFPRERTRYNVKKRTEAPMEKILRGVIISAAKAPTSKGYFDELDGLFKALIEYNAGQKDLMKQCFGVMLYILSRHPKTWTVFANSPTFREKEHHFTALAYHKTFYLLGELFEVDWDGSRRVQDILQLLREGYPHETIWKFTDFSDEPCSRFGFDTTNISESVAASIKKNCARYELPLRTLKIMIDGYNDQVKTLISEVSTSPSYNGSFLSTSGSLLKKKMSECRHSSHVPTIFTVDHRRMGVDVILQCESQRDIRHKASLKWSGSRDDSSLKFDFSCDMHIEQTEMFRCPCGCLPLVFGAAKEHSKWPMARDETIRGEFESYLYPKYYDDVKIKQILDDRSPTLFISVPTKTEQENYGGNYSLHQVRPPPKYIAGRGGKGTRILSKGENNNRSHHKHYQRRGEEKDETVGPEAKSGVKTPVKPVKTPLSDRKRIMLNKIATDHTHADGYFTAEGVVKMRDLGNYKTKRTVHADWRFGIGVEKSSDIRPDKYIVFSPANSGYEPKVVDTNVSRLKYVSGDVPTDLQPLSSEIRPRPPSLRTESEGDKSYDNISLGVVLDVLSLQYEGDSGDMKIKDSFTTAYEHLLNQDGGGMLSLEDASGLSDIEFSQNTELSDTGLHLSQGLSQNVPVNYQCPEVVTDSPSNQTVADFIRDVDVTEMSDPRELISKNKSLDLTTAEADKSFSYCGTQSGLVDTAGKFLHLYEMLKARVRLKLYLPERQVDELFNFYSNTQIADTPQMSDEYDCMAADQYHAFTVGTQGADEWFADGGIDYFIRLINYTLEPERKVLYDFEFTKYSETKSYENCPKKFLDYKLMEQDCILIPLSDSRTKEFGVTGSHYFLCFIQPQLQRITFYDSMYKVDLLGHEVSNPLRKYPRRVEWIQEFVKKKCAEDGMVHDANWVTTAHHGPVQPNGYDCGVYMLASMLSFSLGFGTQGFESFLEENFISKFRICVSLSILSNRLIYPTFVRRQSATPQKKRKYPTFNRTKNTTNSVERKAFHGTLKERIDPLLTDSPTRVDAVELKTWLTLHGVRYYARFSKKKLISLVRKALLHIAEVKNVLRESKSIEEIKKSDELIDCVEALLPRSGSELLNLSGSSNNDVAKDYINIVDAELCCSGKTGCFFRDRRVYNASVACIQCNRPVHGKLCTDKNGRCQGDTCTPDTPRIVNNIGFISPNAKVHDDDGTSSSDDDSDGSDGSDDSDGSGSDGGYSSPEYRDNHGKLHEKKKRRKEPLRVGDIIEYENTMIYAFGSRALTTARVVATTPGARFPLKLDNTDFLDENVKVRRTHAFIRGELNEVRRGQYHHAGYLKPISNFRLRKRVLMVRDGNGSNVARPVEGGILGTVNQLKNCKEGLEKTAVEFMRGDHDNAIDKKMAASSTNKKDHDNDRNSPKAIAKKTAASNTNPKDHDNNGNSPKAIAKKTASKFERDNKPKQTAKSEDSSDDEKDPKSNGAILCKQPLDVNDADDDDDDFDQVLKKPFFPIDSVCPTARLSKRIRKMPEKFDDYECHSPPRKRTNRTVAVDAPRKGVGYAKLDNIETDF